MALVAMGYKGVTTSLSAQPIIGTDRLDSCAGMILYNSRRQIASCTHGSVIDAEKFYELQGQTRCSIDDTITAHFAGVAIEAGSLDCTIRIRELDILVQRMLAEPNLRIETFDIASKPHPTGMALDTRSGKLIGLTSLVSELRQYRPVEEFYTLKTSELADFDGRVAASARVRRS